MGRSTSSHAGLRRGFLVWDGIWCGGTLDGWGCSGRLSPGWCLVLPDEEEPELIEVLSFLPPHPPPMGGNGTTK